MLKLLWKLCLLGVVMTGTDIYTNLKLSFYPPPAGEGDFNRTGIPSVVTLFCGRKNYFFKL